MYALVLYILDSGPVSVCTGLIYSGLWARQCMYWSYLLDSGPVSAYTGLILDSGPFSVCNGLIYSKLCVCTGLILLKDTTVLFKKQSYYTELLCASFITSLLSAFVSTSLSSVYRGVSPGLLAAAPVPHLLKLLPHLGQALQTS